VLLKPLTNSPGGFDRLGSRFDNAMMLERAGVDVIIGSFNSHNARWLLQEAGNAVRFGLPWDAALRAVTLAPAQALGVGDRYGSLEPGKVGNLVVWTGDPFELSTRAEAVVIRGAVTSLDHRQLELFRRYRELDEERPAFKRAGF
jgi:imidazolonepropionase-like amidohydrolase